MTDPTETPNLPDQTNQTDPSNPVTDQTDQSGAGDQDGDSDQAGPPETPPGPIETPNLKQLDHDGDKRAGGSKRRPATEWVVTRAEGLHQVPTKQSGAVLDAGGRIATDRDLKVAGIERD